MKSVFGGVCNSGLQLLLEGLTVATLKIVSHFSQHRASAAMANENQLEPPKQRLGFNNPVS